MISIANASQPLRSKKHTLSQLVELVDGRADLSSDLAGGPPKLALWALLSCAVLVLSSEKPLLVFWDAVRAAQTEARGFDAAPKL
jgi:hypothetical protein